MITKNDIRESFDSAENSLRSCWEVLANLKKNGKITHEKIVEFQPKLAKTLFKIDELYVELNKEKNDYIDRKQSLNIGWFENRLRKIADYQRALEGLISIGLMLGDAFAWIFYHNKRNEIAKQYKYELNRHFPPGIGGKGEIEFISNVPVINNHIVIYHEITTFLRLGDISLINMEDLSLTAIGELKSRTEDEKSININLTTISGGKEEYKTLGKELSAFHKNIPVSESTEERKMSQSVQDRLNRQLEKIDTSLKEDRNVPNKAIESDNLIEELSKLCEATKNKQHLTRKIDNRLLLTGVKNRKKSLYSKFLKPVSKNYLKVLDNYDEKIKMILKEDSPHNYIYLHEPCNPDENYFLEPGMVPLYHWPLKIGTIKSLLFQDINLLTAYNPVNLIENLESKGFKFKKDRTDKYNFDITKKHENGTIKIERFVHLLRLIGVHFFSEESILEMLLMFDGRNSDRFENTNKPHSIGMHVTQNFGSPPS